MTTIKVFVASSSELSDQREQIGDYIRRLSYDYSPRGIRLQMLCWEDFYPEYKGISKQKEYDEQLIKICDIFFALFRTRCGKYTQHEVEYALSLDKECHILQLPSKEENVELKHFLTEQNLSTRYCNDNDLISCINSILDDYMHRHDLRLSSLASPIDTWRLYATIPDDIAEIRIPFSNMIRGLESFLEERLGCYFTLHPYNTINNIASTDHFICFIKDSWSQQDEEEVDLAYKNCQNANMPETTILYQKEGHSGVSRNPLAIKINSEYEGFSKAFANLDTVKSDLNMWALRQKMPVVFENVFSVEGLNICLNNRPYFYLPMFPDLHRSVRFYVDEINKIDRKIKKNSRKGKVKDEALAQVLANRRFANEQSLQKLISDWYNKTQLQQYAQNIWTKTQFDSIQRGQLQEYKELTNQVKKCTQQCEQDSSSKNLKDLSSLLLSWESVADVCLSLNDIEVTEYIQVLTHIVQVCDTYLHPSEIDFDEDAIFKKIVETADKYNHHTLFTEVMRVNYANSFVKDLDYKTSGSLYKEAYQQISNINDDSAIANHNKSFVIHSLLLFYVRIDDKEAILELGKQYETLIHKWQQINQQESYDVDLARCYSCVLAAAPKEYGVCAVLADRAEKLLEVLHKKYDSRPFDEDYYDAICYFSVVLSAYYIDRFEKGDDVYYKKALRYINESRESLIARYPYDPEYIERSMSQPFHNRAYLYSINGEWDKAISNYKSALKKRKDLYHKTLSEENLFEIAQTYINLGDVYRLQKRYDKANECADEAFNIYEQKKDEKLDIFDMLYYEAYQLKATVLMDQDEANGIYPQKALDMMQECIDWSNSHPNNDYAPCFNYFSGRLLQIYKKK